jgi:N-terminal domain of (some) glycogen debranching enzymes/Amylo-alpha-1,6-glucosidase
MNTPHYIQADNPAGQEFQTVPQHHQPFLHDLITVLAAPTQVLSQRSGEIVSGNDAASVQGLIHADVRVLSGLKVTINGEPAEHLATVLDGNSAQFTFLLPTVGAGLDLRPDAHVRLDWFRLVEPGQLAETLMISSHLLEPIDLDVGIELTCDFAPLELIRGGLATPPVPFPEPSGDRYGWVHEDMALSLVAEGADLTASEDHRRLRLHWQVKVPAYGQVSLPWRLGVEDTGSVVVVPSAPPLKITRPSGIGNLDHALELWLAKSLEDLNSLWMATRDAPEDGFFAAGSPWYLTLFGRDSIWAARMVLPLDLAPARGTLRTLARRQGSRVDISAAEEPGKILHELRRTTVHFGTSWLPPVYYGAIDATPLWICLLHDAWRAGLPDADVTELLPALEQALLWLIDHGDVDDDGFLEYRDASGHGLTNHGWKDSYDSIRFHDGKVAEGPVALCEAQGYAYEAATAGASLLDAFSRPGADRYRIWAAELADRFRARFWCGIGDDRYPALALDGAKQLVDSLTSNIGHLLGTGILNAEEELLIAKLVASPALDSGLGLRTMADTDAGYAPLSYHCGSVWPHDTAIVIAGLVRAGLAAYATGLIEGLLRASIAFEQRLPELWSGEGRPVPYPAACHPQAWSAASAVVVANALGVL